MAAEDKQIQVWAKPIDNGPRVVFVARCVTQGSIEWNWSARDKSERPSTRQSIDDALDEWATDGEDRLWEEIEIVAASAATAAKHVQDEPAAWHYEQRWWWCNWGSDEGQVVASGSLKDVARVDAIKNFRHYLRKPFGPA